MTYCVGVMLESCLIFASDSRTNAGLDKFASFCKRSLFERVEDRVIVLLSSGNLGGTPCLFTRDSGEEGALTWPYLAIHSSFAAEKKALFRQNKGIRDAQMGHSILRGPRFRIIKKSRSGAEGSRSACT